MLPIVSNKLGVMAGVAQSDAVDTDCIAVSCVTRMTSEQQRKKQQLMLIIQLRLSVCPSH